MEDAKSFSLGALAHKHPSLAHRSCGLTFRIAFCHLVHLGAGCHLSPP